MPIIIYAIYRLYSRIKIHIFIKDECPDTCESRHNEKVLIVGVSPPQSDELIGIIFRDPTTRFMDATEGIPICHTHFLRYIDTNSEFIDSTGLFRTLEVIFGVLL